MANKKPDLATHLARKIFEVGDESKDKVRRIQFRGGVGHTETDLGGLCEPALATHIRSAIDQYGHP